MHQALLTQFTAQFTAQATSAFASAAAAGSPASTADPAAGPSVRSAVVLFTAVAIVMLTGIVILLLAILSHRRKRARAGLRTDEDPAPTPDAWTESGRRLQPYKKS